MKTWIQRSLIGVALAAVLGGGLAACGHRGHDDAATPERVAEWRGKTVARVSRKLELDPAQKLKLEALADTLVAQRAALIGPKPDPRAEMKALVAGATFDRDRATALLGDKTRALEAATPQVVDALAAFFDSLNPTQQAELRAYLDKRGG